MSEVQALHKLPCLRCGADLTWSAGREAVACPYCSFTPTEEEIEAARAAGRREGLAVAEAGEGTSAPEAPLEPRRLIEHDLEEGLLRFPRAGSVKAEKKERLVRCENCKALTQFDSHRTAQRCDFCGSPAIVPVEEESGVILPEGVLPVTIPEPEVRTRLRQWYGNRWFAPNRLKRAALTDTLQGIYFPYWTFDARAQSEWRAESGYYYYETEYYTDSKGHRRSRRARRVRWERSEGAANHFFDDDLVPGVKAVYYSLLRQVEPFTMKGLKLYDPIYIRGWIVERYQRDLHEAEETNRRQMDDAMRSLCGKQVPGDTYRNLRVETEYSERTYKHILVPIWIVSYTYGRRTFQVIVNGATGAIAGERPYSIVKIAFAVLALLIVICIAAAWVAHGS